MKSYVLLADPAIRETLKRRGVDFTEWNDKAVLISDFGNLGQALAALDAYLRVSPLKRTAFAGNAMNGMKPEPEAFRQSGQ